jgi:hypothetical protein
MITGHRDRPSDRVAGRRFLDAPIAEIQDAGEQLPRSNVVATAGDGGGTT